MSSVNGLIGYFSPLKQAVLSLDTFWIVKNSK
jgi:hypothetical protein